MTAFCAICSADIPGEPLRRPLGRNDAMVAVCVECDDTHPRSGRYGFSDGASPGRSSTMQGTGNRWSSAAGRRSTGK